METVAVNCITTTVINEITIVLVDEHTGDKYEKLDLSIDRIQTIKKEVWRVPFCRECGIALYWNNPVNRPEKDILWAYGSWTEIETQQCKGDWTVHTITCMNPTSICITCCITSSCNGDKCTSRKYKASNYCVRCQRCPYHPYISVTCKDYGLIPGTWKWGLLYRLVRCEICIESWEKIPDNLSWRPKYHLIFPFNVKESILTLFVLARSIDTNLQKYKHNDSTQGFSLFPNEILQEIVYWLVEIEKVRSRPYN